jgi:hypothetical protein
MSEQPPGVYPLIFESGVVRIDEDGVLHVHLTHGPEAPHPLATHPDGEQTTIPGAATAVTLAGGDRDTVRVRCSMRETDALPDGFVFRIEGWRLVQLEMSGDLTVVVEGIHTPPPWFQPGKVHRFDGPEGDVRIHTSSQPLVASKPPAPSPPPRPPPAASPSPAPGSSAPTGGCGSLLVVVLAVGWALGSLHGVL